MPLAVSSVGVGRRAKDWKTALVSYSDLDVTLKGNISDTSALF